MTTSTVGLVLRRHVAIDDASRRLAYTEVLNGLGRERASGFLGRALNWFERLGVRVERMMTDNGRYGDPSPRNAVRLSPVPALTLILVSQRRRQTCNYALSGYTIRKSLVLQHQDDVARHAPAQPPRTDHLAVGESAAAEIQIRPPSTAKTAPNPVVIHAHSTFRRKRSLNRPVRGHLGPLSASAPSSAFPTGSTSKVKSSGPAFSKYNVASTDCRRPIGAERPTCMAWQPSAPRQYSPLLGFRDRPLSGASWRRRPPRRFGGFHLGFRWRAGGPIPVLVRIIWTAAVSVPGRVVARYGA